MHAGTQVALKQASLAMIDRCIIMETFTGRIRIWAIEDHRGWAVVVRSIELLVPGRGILKDDALGVASFDISAMLYHKALQLISRRDSSPFAETARLLNVLRF